MKNKNYIPAILSEAVADGRWHDPGPEVLRRILGPELDLPDLELFDLALMQRVSEQVDDGGYVDDSEFCMRRGDSDSGVDDDDERRLAFEHALFVAGSTVPGDDVFVALDLRHSLEDPAVLVFDWRRPVPRRWVPVGRLSDLLADLARYKDS